MNALELLEHMVMTGGFIKAGWKARVGLEPERRYTFHSPTGDSFRVQESQLGPLYKWGYLINGPVYSGDLYQIRFTPEGRKKVMELRRARLATRRLFPSVLDVFADVPDAYRVALVPDDRHTGGWVGFIYPASDPLIYAAYFFLPADMQTELIAFLHEWRFRPDKSPDSGWCYLHMDLQPDYRRYGQVIVDSKGSPPYA